MDIIFPYSFSQNVLDSSLGMFRIFLWCVPVGLLIAWLKNRRSLLSLLSALVCAAVLFQWEYQSLNNRFGVLSYRPDQLRLEQGNGNTVLLAPADASRFQSVSIGRNGGWSCFLLVRTQNADYESFIVSKDVHSCADDAAMLNAFYGKH
ncbi:hypothetical protein ACQUQU_17420 [Thalassolituus sp. LLYu03]|uniref:hypothetical protein n=1 Tax=Thalassolituus sp. LLYu03 TaxID=3421656 RepID=UPI003D2DFDDF